MQVKKAVIPAAGFGTRFLPASKTIPKEMLPILDRPMIQYVVEEAVAAGITQIVIVTSRGKEAMADYFDRSPELERALAQKGATAGLEEVRRVASMAEVVFVRQQEQLGLGHAVLCARPAVGKEPFAVFLPDDIIYHPPKSGIAQLLEVYQQFGASVVAVEELPREAIRNYGAIEPREVAERTYEVLGLVEKPDPAVAPSNLGIVGRYVLTPEIFDCLEGVRPGAIGELQLTDALALLLKRQKVYACRFRGVRYDVGTPLGMLRASLELALTRPEYAPHLRRWMGDLLHKSQ
ncbi:MAG: UTP--glucose-1-phosphate uridylyltransferase GalU [Chloroflexi bacterium]|nr:UTP--glucose-1-phosphate uridylyltransferase GalU [Chloroflexota bacterium]